jgi:diguanylate cyclase (GGDEF)-like protein
MNENFAFILPIMQLSFGICFLIAGRWRVPSAWWWGVAFVCNGLAFAIPNLPFRTPGHVLAPIADTLFSCSFLFFGQAILEHCGRPTAALRTRLAITFGSILLCTYAVAGLGKLRLELLSSDTACALLLAIPLLRVRDVMRRSGDRVLMIISWLVVLDNVSRVLTVGYTAPESIDDFETSAYAFIYQATAAVIGIGFAMSALATVVTSVLTRYRTLAMTDPLSGLLNRRGFEEMVGDRGSAKAMAGSVVAVDIDHFKSVNDRFGHDVGDKVIVTLADAIRAKLPDAALAARFGGEEFVIYLADAPAAVALSFAEAVRRDFSGRAALLLGPDARVTASFGISLMQPDDYSVHDALHRADEGLYEAKHGGRDRTVVQFSAKHHGRQFAGSPAEVLHDAVKDSRRSA